MAGAAVCSLNSTSAVHLLLEAGQAGSAPSSQVSKRSTWQQRERVTTDRNTCRGNTQEGYRPSGPSWTLCTE